MGEAITAARPRDPAGLALARARVEGALFGASDGFGRFHILERLGRGGMGVVYAAYDPELDRGVALKMLHLPARGRELAVAEAKALARLSHPNVVPVFDVGVVEDHVYIVMELVRGVTLREWAEGRPARAIIEVYLQAGAALAAAHDAGLVHRDFKPDNAIVGGDGRVRVVDFGLACEAEATGDGSAPRRAAGTPRYMAPEQASGQVAPAADQFSFCVSLDEALRAGGAAPPRWLAELIARGSAPDPAERFASMRELLRALGRDPARVRRRWIAGGVAAAALAAAFGVAFLLGRAHAMEEPVPCSGGPAAIAAAWPPDARAAQLARIAGLGAYGRDRAGQLARQIDEYAASWASRHRDACLAHRLGLESEALLDRRMACLARSRAALGAVAELARTADAAALPGLALAATALPDPVACADEATLGGEVASPPPAIAKRVAELRDALEVARVQLAAGGVNEARDAARTAGAELRRLGYQPLLAEALLVEGHAAMRSDPPAAVTALGAATTAALESHLDAVAIEAWARRAWIESMEGKADALAELGVIEPLATGRGTSAAFPRALLHNNLGSIELRRGDRVGARARFDRALREARGVTGPAAVELVAIRGNLALVTEDPAARDRVLRGAHAELARLLGEAHPDALLMQLRRATTSVLLLADASALLAGTCERLAVHEALTPMVSPCFAELGDLREELGDRSGAIDAARRSAAGLHPQHPELDGYLALWGGDPPAAIRAFEAALAAAPAGTGEVSFEQYLRSKLLLGYARALRAAGRLAEARAALERRFEGFDASKEPSTIAVERRLARARAELAALIAAAGDAPARARALAGQALTWYRTAGAPRAVLAPLEAITGAAGSP